MAGELLLASQFAAAALMLALAGWLLYLNFSSRLNRAFALFLVMRAMVIVTNRAQDLAPDPAVEAYFGRVSVYFLLGSVFALLFFALIYPRPSTRRSGTIAMATLIALTILVEAAYALDHCLASCERGDLDIAGPLIAFVSALPLVSAIAAWHLARYAREDPSERRGPRVVALGFALNGALDGGISTAVWVATGDLGAGFGGPARFVPHTLAILALVPTTAYLVEVARGGIRRRSSFVLVFLAASTGAVVGYGLAGSVGGFLLGIWRLALPIAAGYALLRHSMFDLGEKARTTLHRATIGAVFVATFFVVSEITESLLTQKLGTALGILAAGLLAFALEPLQRFAQRVALTAVPGPVLSPDLPIEQRRALYRDGAILAWEDGALDASERAMLDRLRAALALPEDEARSIEEGVVAR